MPSESARSRGSSVTARGEVLRRGSGTAACCAVLRHGDVPLARVGFSEVDQNRGERPPSCRPVPTFCRKPVLPVLRAWRRLRPLRGAPLSGRRRRGFRGSSSSIGLLLSLLFLLFADGRHHDADLGKAQRLRPGVQRSSACSTAMRSSASARCAARARRPLPLKLLSIVTSGLSSRWTAVAAGSARQWRSFCPTKKHFSGRASQNNVSDRSSGFQLSESDRPDDRPGTPPTADSAWSSGLPWVTLNTGKIPANRADLRIGTRVRCGRITDFEDGCFT